MPSGEGWTLADASAVRIRGARTPSTGEQLAAAREMPPGPGTYFLQNFEDAATLNSRKVEVKGVLVRQFDGEYLNVLTMDSVASTCEAE